MATEFDIVFDVNGKRVDLRQALPLRQGTLEDLEDAGVPFDGQRMTIKQVGTYLHIILRAANPEVTRDDVRAMTQADIGAVAAAINKFQAAAAPVVPA